MEKTTDKMQNHLYQAYHNDVSPSNLFSIRTRNPNAMQHVSFKLTDLMEPTKMLCKVDGVLKAYSGHIDHHADEVPVVSNTKEE